MDTPPNSPTPDWGTLGPNSDVKPGSGFDIKVSPGAARQGSLNPALARIRLTMAAVSAVAIGILLLGQVIFFKSLRTARGGSVRTGTTGTFDASAQRDAELLMRQAIAGDGTATAQVESRAASWQGHIKLTPQMNGLIKSGLDANDHHVRSATVQLDLAAMNVSQDQTSVDRLARDSDSADHATRIWAIWTLGLLGNRGIDRDRITDLLIAHLHDTDLESRHWAVEALSYVATDAAIEPLLKALHDDPTPKIRERAACGLAESGMFTSEQRRTAIPTLLMYADDPSLDAQTHAWVYHALRDITAQNLPDDAAAWRN